MIPANADGDAPRGFTVTDEARATHRRLDVWLVEQLPDLSRTTIKRLFEDDNVTAVDGRALSLNKMPPAGTVVEVEIPPPIDTDLKPQNIPLEILFEDDHLLVVVKPAGLCVHPANGHPDGTLVNAILYHCPNLQGVGGERRPGIVHRLDLGTSGVMVVAKSQIAHEGLVQLFSAHDIEREYQALVWGTPKIPTARIETFIGRHPHHRQKMSCKVKAGKRAVTDYRVAGSVDKIAHVVCRLHTGRTHQIRVHMAEHLQTPVLCDPLYADVAHQMKHLPERWQAILVGQPHQLLHARMLGFKHPVTGAQLRFEAPAPDPMAKILADFPALAP